MTQRDAPSDARPPVVEPEMAARRETPSGTPPTISPATPPATEPTLRTVAMPADTNADGDIFGGWLLAQMDLAGGLVAIRRARGRVATVAVDSMKFIRPVAVGDEVSLYARVAGVGRTSIRVAIEAWKRPRASEQMEKVTEAIFVFVALGDERRPREVPPEAEPGSTA